MSFPINKKIIYDGNCYLCRSGAMIALKYSRLTEKDLFAFDDLPDDYKNGIDFERFRNEMAVYDTNDKSILYGLDGILYVSGTKYGFFRRIKKGSVFYIILNFLYKTIAYNRYILFPFPSKVKCSCQPSLNKSFRRTLIFICIVTALVMAMMNGILIYEHFRASIPVSVLFGITAFILPFIIQSIISGLFMRGEKFYDYIGNLAVILLSGSLIQALIIPAALLSSGTFGFVATAAILISIWVMTRMHFKRAGLLEVNQVSTLLLFVLLHCAPIFALIII